MISVMIVDDDPLVSGALRVILESDKQGDELSVTDIVSSGSQAVGLAKDKRPDVILMDIRMDGMNGLDASEKILEDNADARIIFLTTFLDDEYIIDAVTIGGDDVRENKFGFDDDRNAVFRYTFVHIQGQRNGEISPLRIKVACLKRFGGIRCSKPKSNSCQKDHQCW